MTTHKFDYVLRILHFSATRFSELFLKVKRTYTSLLLKAEAAFVRRLLKYFNDCINGKMTYVLQEFLKHLAIFISYIS